MVPLYEVKVKRDAHSTTPTTVPAYEIPVLQELFGEENVHNIDGKRVDEVGAGDPVGQFQTENERERLTMKYGADVIDGIFGAASLGKIKQMVEEEKAKMKDVDGEAGAGESKDALMDRARALGLNPHHALGAAKLKEMIAAAEAEAEA